MKKMKIDSTPIDFFTSIPDDVLAKVAFYDWEALERLCIALTLDLQLIYESPPDSNIDYIN